MTTLYLLGVATGAGTVAALWWLNSYLDNLFIEGEKL